MGLVPMVNGTLKIVTILAAIISAGCAFAPGSHTIGGERVAQKSANESVPDIVSIYQVDPATIKNHAAISEVPPPAALTTKGNMPYDYTVGPGDVLNITVWDHPELTIPQGSERSAEEAGNWVHSDGSIFYPYVGKIHVAGMNVMQIRDVITKKIAKYIENPQVDVTVAAFRSQRVYVTGAVRQPGPYPITNVPMHLLDAVNAAGGITDVADWRDVTLTRNGKEYHLSLRAIYSLGDPRHNVLLKPGDVVHVARNDNNKVFVLGEVKQPAPVPMGRDGLSLAGALADAGGMNQAMADASGVFVMRRADRKDNKRHIDVYQLNLNNPAALVLADEFALHPHDIVYVTAAPISRWNRVIQNIMPTVQTVYYGALAQDRLKKINQ